MLTGSTEEMAKNLAPQTKEQMRASAPGYFDMLDKQADQFNASAHLKQKVPMKPVPDGIISASVSGQGYLMHKIDGLDELTKAIKDLTAALILSNNGCNNS